MKYFFFILCGALGLFAGFRLYKYIVDYDDLAEYGKGYVWGNVILLCLALLLLIFLFRRETKKPS